MTYSLRTFVIFASTRSITVCSGSGSRLAGLSVVRSSSTGAVPAASGASRSMSCASLLCEGNIT